jgi:hypothetical protein
MGVDVLGAFYSGGPADGRQLTFAVVPPDRVFYGAALPSWRKMDSLPGSVVAADGDYRDRPVQAAPVGRALAGSSYRSWA